jgi:hypothetical protein
MEDDRIEKRAGMNGGRMFTQILCRYNTNKSTLHPCLHLQKLQISICIMLALLQGCTTYNTGENLPPAFHLFAIIASFVFICAKLHNVCSPYLPTSLV